MEWNDEWGYASFDDPGIIRYLEVGKPSKDKETDII